MSVTYGITPSAKDDPYLAVAEDALKGLVRASNPGSYLGEINCASKDLFEDSEFTPAYG